jgi:threonine dehydratase
MNIPSLEDIRAAQERIRPSIIRSPLVRLDLPDDSRRVYLKLENLQPTGAFKIRGAASTMMRQRPDTLARGVWTASAGNMGQGVAWCARAFGVPCTVVVPLRAPQTKVDALERLGATVRKVSFDAWWDAMTSHAMEGMDGLFVHPFEDEAVIAGNATAGIEIVEDLPEVDTVIVPWGGGGFACGLASALRHLRSRARVIPVEVNTAMPLAASFSAGRATEIVPLPSFVDGMGGRGVFPSMWDLARELVQPPLTVTVPQIADAVRLLATRARIVAEGAGAAPLAAVRAHPVAGHTIVCIVSGGNIDVSTLQTILSGQTP